MRGVLARRFFSLLTLWLEAFMLPWALQSMTLFPAKGRLRYGCGRN